MKKNGSIIEKNQQSLCGKIEYRKVGSFRSFPVLLIIFRSFIRVNNDKATVFCAIDISQI